MSDYCYHQKCEQHRIALSSFCVDHQDHEDVMSRFDEIKSVTVASPKVEARGAKETAGKADVSMVSWELIEGLARVRMFGRDKYTKITGKDARDNWKKGIPVNEAVAAAIRHCFKALNIQKNDEESGLSHILHAIASLEHALYTEVHYPELDDRKLGKDVRIKK